jgi:hypothetical protein
VENIPLNVVEASVTVVSTVDDAPEEDGTPKYNYGYPDEDDVVDITWVNLDAESDFTLFRCRSGSDIKTLLVGLGKAIDTGVFDVVFNVSASRRSLYITVGCSKTWDECIKVMSFGLVDEAV